MNTNKFMKLKLLIYMRKGHKQSAGSILSPKLNKKLRQT